MEKYKNKILVLTMTVFLAVLTCMCWFGKSDGYSETERRYLKAFPELTMENITSGRFMTDFESYTQDRFPARDMFRGIKSATALFVFAQRDNNDLYLTDGFIGKLEYPYNAASAEHAAKVFMSVYDKFIAGKDCNVYYALIPDKNYYLAAENGYPTMDYAAMEADMQAGMQGMIYIDLFGVMEADDFYRTDTHWRQEEITDVADIIINTMGGTLELEYELCKLDEPFYGVYYGQLMLPVEGETLYYLDHELFDECYVYDYTAMKEISIYDMEKAEGVDPYEMFLSGPLSLITIENPDADTDKELVVFRDSFGSSIAPLFVEEYSKITLVDIRYLYSGMLGNYIEFENQDVLFLYSTMVLNNSETIK